MLTVSDITTFATDHAKDAVLFVLGGLMTGLLTYARGRLRVLEYTVLHNRVGVSVDDSTFGSVRVTWQGATLNNLWMTTVTLENTTWRDYDNLELNVYAGANTLLLNQSTEISGSTHPLRWTPAYQAKMLVAPGAVATDAQWKEYHNARDFSVPVLNRGHRIVLKFLTNVPSGDATPRVWLDLLHSGLKVEFRELEPRSHGAPIRRALPTGILATLAIVSTIALASENAWITGAVALLAGLFVMPIGAFLYRTYRLARALIAN